MTILSEMDFRQRHRSEGNAAEMLRGLQQEAPLGQLLRSLQPDTPWSAPSATPTAKQSRGTWHMGSRERSTPSPVDSAGRDDRHNPWVPRRCLTPSASSGEGQTPSDSGRSVRSRESYRSVPRKRAGTHPASTAPASTMLPHLQPSKRLTDKPTPLTMNGLAKTAPSRRPETPKFARLMSCKAFEANPRFRSHMEDAAVILDPFLESSTEGEQWSYFAVYDGHGGRQAVDYVEGTLHDVVLCELTAAKRSGEKLTDVRIRQVFERSFHQVDDQLKLLGSWKCGCTATVALVHRTAAGTTRLHLANVGDSSAALLDANGHAFRISVDHRPNDIGEVLRVEAVGGFIARNRVNGQLGVSRALGDHWLKSSGVTWQPHVCSRDVTRDVALVIGSDGLWDAITENEVQYLVEQSVAGDELDRTAPMAAETLVRAAQRHGSHDNITSLVVFLDGSMSR
mmetsp:Transcript_11371/g.21570  ORF Transcript_11371/g.21570 Transcript_11371/m.21570 type:complete len:453 (+) Transcript_11371:14-1372(+)